MKLSLYDVFSYKMSAMSKIVAITKGFSERLKWNEKQNWRPLQRKFRSAIKPMIENWVTGVHFRRRFDRKPTVRATRGSSLKFNLHLLNRCSLPVNGSLPSILPFSHDVYNNVRSFLTLWIVYFILIPLVSVVIFLKWEGFLPRNLNTFSR